jgi:predicted nucleic acid-binding protein
LIFVVDASVAVKWALDEPGRQDALAVLNLDAELWAPDVLFAEVANVFRKKIRAQRSTADQAYLALDGLRASLSRIAPSVDLYRQAFAIALEIDHPVYDCFYVAMALSGGTMVSADEALVSKCKQSGYGRFVSSISNILESVVVSVKPSGLTADVVRLAGLVEQTLDHLGNNVVEASGAFRFVDSAKFAPAFDSPAYRGLVRLIRGASADDLSELIALSWTGRSYQRAEDWDALRDRARLMVDEGRDRHERYFASLMSGVAQGLQKLAQASADAEAASTPNDE